MVATRQVTCTPTHCFTMSGFSWSIFKPGCGHASETPSSEYWTISCLSVLLFHPQKSVFCPFIYLVDTTTPHQHAAPQRRAVPVEQLFFVRLFRPWRSPNVSIHHVKLPPRRL